MDSGTVRGNWTPVESKIPRSEIGSADEEFVW